MEFEIYVRSSDDMFVFLAGDTQIARDIVEQRIGKDVRYTLYQVCWQVDPRQRCLQQV